MGTWLMEAGKIVYRSEGFKVILSTAVACAVSLMTAETDARCRRAGKK